jgi:hypothetical protein
MTQLLPDLLPDDVRTPAASARARATDAANSVRQMTVGLVLHGGLRQPDESGACLAGRRAASAGASQSGALELLLWANAS